VSLTVHLNSVPIVRNIGTAHPPWCGEDPRTSRTTVPVGARCFAPVQTYLGAHPVSYIMGRLRLKRDGTSAVTIFLLSEKRTSPFELAGVSAQSAASRRSVHIVSLLVVTLSQLRPVSLSLFSLAGYPLHSPVSP
jgi:hypothetical protein